MCVLSVKVPIRKKSGNLFNDPRIFTKMFVVKLKGHCSSRTPLVRNPKFILEPIVKPSDALEIWEMWSTPLLPLLPGPP